MSTKQELIELKEVFQEYRKQEKKLWEHFKAIEDSLSPEDRSSIGGDLFDRLYTSAIQKLINLEEE